MSVEKGGDFTVGTDGVKAGKYFAMVSIVKVTGDKDAGTADGGTHAHDPLGTLKCQGACWVNERAKVCAAR